MRGRKASPSHFIDCPKCHARKTPHDLGTAICATCYQAIVEHCKRDQERDYLINYLSTREHDNTAQVRRLRQKAQALGLRWSKPVKPYDFAQRLSDALSPYRPARKTRGRKKIA
jgi:hypothetical protein